jgi:hypothetical protein
LLGTLFFGDFDLCFGESGGYFERLGVLQLLTNLFELKLFTVYEDSLVGILVYFGCPEHWLIAVKLTGLDGGH